MTILAGNTSGLVGSGETLNPLRGKANQETTVAVSGTVESATFPVSSTIGSVSIRVVVYRVSDGVFLGQSDIITPASTGNATATVSTPFPVVAGEKIRIFALADNYIGVGTDNTGTINLREFDSAIADINSSPASEPVLGVNASPGELGIYLEGTESGSGPSISAAQNVTSEGQTRTITLAGNTNAPTAVKLGALTLDGADWSYASATKTISYTAPLLPDNDTLTITVTVDSTNVNAQISYANSYIYELTNHGEPEPNSIMEGNSFATTGPVELKVVSDFNASIVTVDWAAMSSGQEWLTDIRNAASVTKVADGSSSCTIAYFVPETGATDTFNRTITTTDTLSPGVDSVDVPTPGTYHVGQTLTFTTNWNEVVDVTGVPALNLDVGGSARQANYVSGTGTAALVFEYTVQEGDLDEDGVAVASLTLDGGTIKDGASNDAYLTLNSVGDTAGVLVDGLPIGVASVSVPTAGTYSPGNDLDFTVNFESAVNVTGVPELLLIIGEATRAATYVSGAGTSVLLFRHTVVSGDSDADGIGVGSLILAGGTIKDAYGVSADLALNGVGDTSGVLVDGVGPAISISPLTTLDTTPIVSGSAGDAVSLTLVVTGVGTYSPVPSGGSWSQQLPEVALGDYAMTLNGEDANGNAAVERSATLSVVEEIVTADAGLFRSLFTEQGINLFKSLFR